MIFQPDAIDLIRARRKTQTRRPVQLLKPPRPQIPEKACRYKPGHTYSVQPGRGQRGLFIITIEAVRQERLGDITLKDAKREGFEGLPGLKLTAVDRFRERWEQLHGGWVPDDRVWVIDFSMGDQLHIFDPPRLLAATPGHVEYERAQPSRPGARGRWQIADDGEEHQDYTSRLDRGARGEPECPSPGELKVLVKDAHRRDDLRIRTERAETELSERIGRLEARAKTGDQQAQRALFVINQRLDRVERGQARESEAA